MEKGSEGGEKGGSEGSEEEERVKKGESKKGGTKLKRDWRRE